MNRLLDTLLRHQHLSEDEAAHVLGMLVDVDTPPALAGAILAAMRSKGETPDEVRGFAQAMRARARRPIIDDAGSCVDVVGTGGDASGSVNLSTGSALLAAAAGARVVKHGNRAASSRCGSADVIEALGLPLPLDEHRAGACLRATGFTFLLATYYHPALKAMGDVRRTMGVRTIFNLLGPLTNPASPGYAVLGAYSEHAAQLMASTAAGLGLRRAFVIHGAGGWDEPTPVGPFVLFDVGPGGIARHERDASMYGLPRCSPDDLRGGDAAENAGAIRDALRGRRGPVRDAIVLGAALALEACGRARSAEHGCTLASGAIDDGSAAGFLDRLAAFGRADAREPVTHG